MFKRFLVISSLFSIFFSLYIFNMNVHAQEANKTAVSKPSQKNIKKLSNKMADKTKSLIQLNNVRKRCRAPANELINFLVGNDENPGIVAYYDDKSSWRIFTGMVSSQDESGTRVSSFSISQDSQCTRNYETTKLWNVSCESAMKTFDPTFKYVALLNNYTKIYQLHDNLHIYASEYPNNTCMTIQKEVIYTREIK